LRPIADTAERVAENEMPKADEALSRAQRKDTDAPRREEQLKQADEELARAQKHLDALRQENEKLAQSRLDQPWMEPRGGRAARQQQLAQRADELSVKNLTQDPAARQELEAVRAEQNQLAEELRRLAQESELFRNALDATRAEQAQKLADQAKDLAQAQRDLNEAAKGALPKEIDPKLAELVRKQQDLADRAGELARRTAVPVKLANKQPLPPA